MQKLAHKFEAEISFDFGTLVGMMENSRPSPLSLMQEMVADGHSFAAAYVDFQSRLFRPMEAPAAPRPHRVRYPSSRIHSPAPYLVRCSLVHGLTRLRPGMLIIR